MDAVAAATVIVGSYPSMLFICLLSDCVELSFQDSNCGLSAILSNGPGEEL